MNIQEMIRNANSVEAHLTVKDVPMNQVGDIGMVREGVSVGGVVRLFQDLGVQCHLMEFTKSD